MVAVILNLYVKENVIASYSYNLRTVQKQGKLCNRGMREEGG
jgi:hypothetical protein